MKTITLLLFTTMLFSQNSIVASGSSNITIGETFPIMQTVQEEKEVTLSTPKFEILIETKKEVKKISWIEKIVLIIKNLFK